MQAKYIALPTSLPSGLKMGQNYLSSSTYHLSFRKIMGYRYLNVRINSVNESSILSENFVKFGLTSGVNGLFVNVR